MNRLSEEIADNTFKPTACHNIAVGLNCKVTVTAVTAIVDGFGVTLFGYLEQSLLIEEQCPKMVLQIEYGAGVFILCEFLPDTLKKITILLGGDMRGFLFRSRTVTSESEYIHSPFHHEIDYVRNFIDISA